MFRHDNAHLLDDPERQKWLPVGSVVEGLALRPGSHVADVGAGTGYFARPMARAVSPGGQVLAVDVQPEMLEHLRSRLEPGLPVTLVRGDAAYTTLGDRSVDRILMANVWHELDDQGGALAEMTRILRLAGRLGILDWRPDATQPPGPPLDHRTAASDVDRAPRSGGWTVEATDQVGSFSYLLVATRR